MCINMTINRQAKVAQGNIDRYNRSDMVTLNHAYARPSTAKENAYWYCRRLMAKLNGWGLKVISYNTFMFTAGFLFKDKETGVIKFMYITPNYDIAIDY